MHSWNALLTGANQINPHFSSLTGFCTDESTFQETETTDLTNTFIDMNSEYFNLFEKIMTSDGEIMKLLKMISSGIAGVKQNKH